VSAVTRRELLRKIYNDELILAYVEAMLWSSTDESDESGGYPLDENYELEDFTVEGLQRIVSDCEEFLAMPGVEAAIDEEAIDDEMVGHDLWLTRNGHGAGFWDRGYPKKIDKVLTDAAHSMGEQWPYVGDNGRLYIM